MLLCVWEPLIHFDTHDDTLFWPYRKAGIWWQESSTRLVLPSASVHIKVNQLPKNDKSSTLRNTTRMVSDH